MLDAGELDRRLKALRMLRQLSQAQLEHELDDRGLNKTDIGKIERGEKDLKRAMLQQLAEILNAPEAYFTNPNLDAVLFRRPANGDPLLGRDMEADFGDQGPPGDEPGDTDEKDELGQGR